MRTLIFLAILGLALSVKTAQSDQELFSFGDVLGDADSAAKIVDAGIEIAGDAFVVEKKAPVKNDTSIRKPVATPVHKPVATPVHKPVIAPLRRPVAAPVHRPVSSPVHAPSAPSSSGSSGSQGNGEELFSFGDVLGDADSAAKIVDAGIEIAGDAFVVKKAHAKNVTAIKRPVVAPIRRPVNSPVHAPSAPSGSGSPSSQGNGEELFSFGDMLGDADSAAKIVDAGIEIAGDAFVIKKAHKNITAIRRPVNSPVHAPSSSSGSGSPSQGNGEELFSFGDMLGDADSAAKIVDAGIEIAGDAFVVEKKAPVKNATSIKKALVNKTVHKPVVAPVHKPVVAPVHRPVAAPVHRPVVAPIRRPANSQVHAPSTPSGSGSHSSPSQGNGEELFSFGDIGDVAGIVSTGIKVAGLIGDAAAFERRPFLGF